MKVFISWSGEFSKEIAESLKKWIPCMVPSVEVFFSPEDIEKGENWDSKITNELLECKYGIVCLTDENVSAPWIHFEAGALAKTLDSRVATIMINVTPTDIKGPLSRYQATKIDKKDFFHLIENINNQSDNPNKSDVLTTLFNGLWDNICLELNEIIEKHKKVSTSKKKQFNNNEAIEEILLLLRKQNSVINSPHQLLPIEYFKYINDEALHNPNSELYERVIRELFQYLHWTLDRCEANPDLFIKLNEIQLDRFIESLPQFLNKRTDREIYYQYRNIRNHLIDLNSRFSRFEIEDDNDGNND